tara:strand:+ start:2871 stop:3407 length:537 start_codon:yes stop_codon:yes gene_type:complete
MLYRILNNCDQEWTRALNEKKHSFRFFNLATSNSNIPELRVVVLRDYDSKKKEFTIYTDARSQKVLSLENNKNVELLFYDPEKLTQIRVQATCIQMTEDNSLFNQQPTASQRDYTTRLAPGTLIESDVSVDFLKGNHYFLKIIFEATQIEYLQLKRPSHIRVLFKKQESKWLGKFRTP